MPDTARDRRSALVDFVLRRARDTAIVNIYPMAALTKGMRGEEMTEIGLLEAAGAVVFTDGDRSVTNTQVLRRALTYARDFDALIVASHRRPRSGRRRRDARRRTGSKARPCRHSATPPKRSCWSATCASSR